MAAGKIVIAPQHWDKCGRLDIPNGVRSCSSKDCASVDEAYASFLELATPAGGGA